MVDIERRFTTLTVEVRASKGDSRAIGGYASVFNRISSNLGGFVEQVAPTFFNKSRGDGWPGFGQGVMARYNHDDNMLLGTTSSGRLRLDLDETGLIYEVDVPHARNDVFELVERGDVRKSSFAFARAPLEDEWTLSDQGYPLRTLHSGVLVDVAPVNAPAYIDSTAGLRSLAEAIEADFEEVRKAAESNDLGKFFSAKDAPKMTFGPMALLELKAKETPKV